MSSKKATPTPLTIFLNRTAQLNHYGLPRHRQYEFPIWPEVPSLLIYPSLIQIQVDILLRFAIVSSRADIQTACLADHWRRPLRVI